MTVHASDLGLLFVELVLVGGVILALLGLRGRLGLGPIYLFVGSLQYLQTILASTLYLEPVSGLFVSPGSAVMFSGTIFAILVMYIAEDIPATRSLIAGVLTANLTLTVLSLVTGLQFSRGHALNVLDTPPELFQVDPWVFLVGTLVLAVDAIAVVVVFEWLATRRIPSVWLHAVLTLGGVLAVDATAFTGLAFVGREDILVLWSSQLAGKLAAAAVYGTMLWAYLKLQGESEAHSARPVWSILSYRHRYLEALQEQARLQSEVDLERKHAEELQRLSDLKDRFVSSINHELRTPITSIGASLKLMEAGIVGPLPDEAADLVRLASRNCDRLVRLINDVLDLQKMEAGELAMHPSNVSVGDLLNRAVEDNQSFAGSREVALIAEPLDEDREVHVDGDRILQVLTNLLANAVSVSKPGDAVRLCAVSQKDGKVRIEVRDEGPGVAMSLAPSVFDRFTQGRTEGAVGGGTGLGLAISRGIVEQHGGKIGFQRIRPKGTCFWFVVPGAV